MPKPVHRSPLWRPICLRLMLLRTMLRVMLLGTKVSNIQNWWFALQRSINVLYDARTGNGIDAVGICQLLERKEGVFRQKMMGKR
ncbi:DNA-directed RNA polymerase I subunit 1-like protein, partial [Drosera capensis]